MTRGRSTTERYYECRDCGHRLTPASHRARCPECGGPLRNVAVPLE